jgi:hypothetical protein
MHLKRRNDVRLTLHSMGFLAVCRFAITNVSRREAAARIWNKRKPEFSRDEDIFVNFTYPITDTNMLVIEGVAKDLAKWEAAVRKADVPEKQ